MSVKAMLKPMRSQTVFAVGDDDSKQTQEKKKSKQTDKEKKPAVGGARSFSSHQACIKLCVSTSHHNIISYIPPMMCSAVVAAVSYWYTSICYEGI